MNFLMMNFRLIKYEQIFVRVCTVNIALVGWMAKTRTSPLLLYLGTPQEGVMNLGLGTSAGIGE